jgi:hypothetical protein
MIINCSYPGCTETFKTDEPCVPDVTFICREHCNLLSKNRQDRDVHFQKFQFDKKLSKNKGKNN